MLPVAAERRACRRSGAALSAAAAAAALPTPQPGYPPQQPAPAAASAAAGLSTAATAAAARALAAAARLSAEPPPPHPPPPPAPPADLPAARYPPSGYGPYPTAPQYALPPEPETRLRRRGFAIGVAIGGGGVRFDDGGGTGPGPGPRHRRLAEPAGRADVRLLVGHLRGQPGQREPLGARRRGPAVLRPLPVGQGGAGHGPPQPRGRLTARPSTPPSPRWPSCSASAPRWCRPTAGFALDLQLRFAGARYDDAGTTTNTALLVGFNFY